jgi:hypothetical protein
MTEDQKQASIDNLLGQLVDTRNSFAAFMDFGDFDGIEAAFNSAMQIAHGALAVVDLELPLPDPTRDMSEVNRNAVLWNLYPTQRPRLITEIARELADGHVVRCHTGARWGQGGCRGIAQEMSDELGAKGINHFWLIDDRRVPSMGNAHHVYTIVFEAA